MFLSIRVPVVSKSPKLLLTSNGHISIITNLIETIQKLLSRELSANLSKCPSQVVKIFTSQEVMMKKTLAFAVSTTPLMWGNILQCYGLPSRLPIKLIGRVPQLLTGGYNSHPGPPLIPTSTTLPGPQDWFSGWMLGLVCGGGRG